MSENKTAEGEAVCLNDLLSAVLEERDNYDRLITNGKGNWPETGYVRDEVWAGWLHTRDTLNSILRRIGR